MYIVSACLLGDNCKYNGQNNKSTGVIKFLSGKNYIAVCPEMLAGFPSTRPPVEIVDGRAVNRIGWDMTERFMRGAEEAWKVSLEESHRYGEEIEGAVLKSRSPSCGASKIYDGTFSGKIIKGDGFTAQYLKLLGIKLMTEEDFQE